MKVSHIPIDSVILEYTLTMPQEAKSIVIFAHGSGSSRHSKRNKFVADTLNNAGIGTLLFDLLTYEEDMLYENRFNINLLTKRLKASTEWLLREKQNEELKIGYFGASTGAAAALQAASELGKTISAVVSRGGRPDLANEFLKDVKSPTLLIVGSKDDTVIELNKQAYKLIPAEKELSTITGASHLFEESGKLEEVAMLATNWFKKYLT